MTQGRRQSRPASGRFVLRMKPGLHDALRQAAKEEGRSLNAYCVRRLAQPPAVAAGHDGPMPAVERAAEQLGHALVGVVAFGSWARGDAADGSDVDVLVIVEAGVPIDRALYRRWDEQPVRWSGRSVDPHFVQLPPIAAPVTGLWAEIARDGIVLYERELRVSRFLTAVRARLLDGSIVRNSVYGQPYWMEATADAEP